MHTHSYVSVRRFLYVILVWGFITNNFVLAKSVSITEKKTSEHRDTVDLVQQGQEFWLNGGLGDLTTEMLGGRDLSELKWGVSTHPTMFYDILPFKWQAVTELPLLNVLPEFEDYTSPAQIRLEDISRKFNIEVIVPDRYEYQLPNDALLVVELVARTSTYKIEVRMGLDYVESSYFIKEPRDLVHELLRYLQKLQHVTVAGVNNRPEFIVREFRGFKFNDESVKQMRFTGIPVAYNIKIGSVMVDSGFQWGGQPEAMPLRYPQIPILTP